MPDLPKDRLYQATPTPSGPVYRIVQFQRPLTAAQMEELRHLGLKLDRYIPDQAYLERITAAQVKSLSQLPYFRWSGLYQPAFKIDPEIGRRTFVTPERRSAPGLILNVRLFPEADLAQVAAALRAAGARVLRTFDDSRFGGRKWMRVQAASMDRVEEIARLEAVEWIEEEGDITPDNGTTTAVVQSGGNVNTPLYAGGLRGEGQVVGIIDNGLDVNHCFFNDPTNPIGPSHRKVLGFREDTTTVTGATCNAPGHGTHTAGTIAGQTDTAPANTNNGIAFNAQLTYGGLSDLSSTGSGTRSFLEYLEAARADGAFVHSNSWSDKSTTVYTVLSQDLDTFTWNHEDQLVVTSSSNNLGTAPSPTRPPWTSKNGLSVAASQQFPNQASVSSGGQGPTADGRRKPDIYAPGQGIVSATATTACGTQACGGSSMATPAVAGAAALVRQYYTEGWYPSGTRQPHHAFVPSGALLKATLLNGTRDMNGSDAAGNAAALNGYPGNLEGWGQLVLDDVLFFPADARNLLVWDVRRAGGLATGEAHQYTLNVATNAQPLRVTLAWMEPPPAAAAFGNPVVNDLDLSIVAPDGTTILLPASVAAGSTDTLNNVEQVVVAAPQPGLYTLRITGATVNFGGSRQGYALVATADTPEPPTPTGAQETLFARVGISDVASGAPPALPNVQNLVANLSTFIDAVSYGQTTIGPVYPAEVALDHPRSHYHHPSRNLLIEMAEEVIAKLIVADSNVFTRGTADPADDIDRLVIVLNDSAFIGDWATTGPWPYDLPGGLNRRLSVSVQSVHNDPDKRWAHGFAHQLGLVDLYAHDGVVFAQPHVDDWDLMAAPAGRTGFLAWSKERANWITGHGSTVTYIPRPAAGASASSTIPIRFLSETSPSTQAVAIGLTEGAATLAAEDVFYWVEARNNVAGGPDVVPEEGVLVYYVNEDVPQGEGPVRILDDDLTTTHLQDAALAVGGAKAPAGTGLTVTVQAGGPGVDRNIAISYDPPETDNDVRITVGDPAWTSPDIWVDAPDNGFDASHDDQPIEGDTNRIYVRVSNPGPGDAFDFTIFVRVSEPYHTVGGSADFNQFVGQLHIVSLPFGGAPFVGYVEWTPDEDGVPHSCIQVEIPSVFNDVNPNNNAAQQNVEERPSSNGSPYGAVVYHFGLTNPEDRTQLFYFRAEGVPAGWTADLDPKKAELAVGERVAGRLTLQPPEDAPACTEHEIRVTSWMPRGDTLVPVGGGTVQVDLRNGTRIDLDAGVGPCQTVIAAMQISPNVLPRKDCARITAAGCTDPPRPNETIIVRYEHPSGYPIYRSVTTDAAGCFSDFLVVAEGGPWEVTAKYPGSDCSGPASKGPATVGVPLTPSEDADGDGLLDPDEPQGDHDGDGQVGLYDPDSDDDGVRDGDESPGDCDRDGKSNVTDPDSDNDGILDSRDPVTCGGLSGFPTSRRLHGSFHLGSTHPLGDLSHQADANIYAQVDATYRLSDRLSLKLMLGLAQLTAESSAATDHPRWVHASLNLQALFPATSGADLYLQAGPGAYRSKAGSTDLGVNLGLGLRIPLQAPFHLELGTDYHGVLNDDDPRFLTLHLGVLFP